MAYKQKFRGFGKDNVRIMLCVKKHTKEKIEILAERSGLKLTKYIYLHINQAIENNLDTTLGTIK